MSNEVELLKVEEQIDGEKGIWYYTCWGEFYTSTTEVSLPSHGDTRLNHGEQRVLWTLDTELLHPIPYSSPHLSKYWGQDLVVHYISLPEEWQHALAPGTMVPK